MKNSLIKKKLEYLFKILGSWGISDLTANHASILDDKKKAFLLTNINSFFHKLPQKI